MKDEEDNLSVFISYAWGGALEKKEWIRQHIVESLKWKYPVFWDRDSIGFGESIDACISKALDQRPLMVFVFAIPIIWFLPKKLDQVCTGNCSY